MGLRQSLLVATSLVLLSAGAAGEPYLAVYKGLQCSACHSHPGGGGKRTVYGNTFAQTEWPAQRVGGSDAALWTGQVVDWLGVGANLRARYEYTDTPNQEEDSEFLVSRGTVYLEASFASDRLSVYVDQQFAPGATQNREAYVRFRSSNRKWSLVAGQFFLPYGLRFEDDTAFVRRSTGVNFTTPDRGVQLIYEAGNWTTIASVTNGTAGGAETDKGKQGSLVSTFVKDRWRAGFSLNANDSDAGDRRMGNVFFGLRTGPVAWLAEVDLIHDDLPAGDRDSIATLVEGNWLWRRGHNLKVTYEYFDPDDDVDENHQTRWSALWEYTPIQFLQARFGVRLYDGIPQIDAQNRDELFVELHGFF